MISTHYLFPAAMLAVIWIVATIGTLVCKPLRMPNWLVGVIKRKP